jgi:hypothetical protein
MFRRVPALLALAITVSALLFASNAVMADGADGVGGIGAIGMRLLDVPANLAEDPRARVYIVDHVAPGTTIQRRAQVANKTHHSVQLSLYVGSATIGGGAFIPADDQDPTDLTSWTSLSRSQVTLPPGSRRTVMATIRVPSTASKGERYGVIWASTTAGPPPGGGVTVVNRVGIRIYLSVGPGGEPTSAFTIESLTASRLSDGRPMVQAQVHNTGGRALDMQGYLRLSDGPDGVGRAVRGAARNHARTGGHGIGDGTSREWAARRSLARTDRPAQRTGGGDCPGDDHLPRRAG